MPSEKELREALDAVQRLRTPPLPGPRQREELLAEVAKVLRQLLPEQASGAIEQVTEPAGDPEHDLENDPVIGSFRER